MGKNKRKKMVISSKYHKKKTTKKRSTRKNNPQSNINRQIKKLARINTRKRRFNRRYLFLAVFILFLVTYALSGILEGSFFFDTGSSLSLLRLWIVLIVFIMVLIFIFFSSKHFFFRIKGRKHKKIKKKKEAKKETPKEKIIEKKISLKKPLKKKKQKRFSPNLNKEFSRYTRFVFIIFLLTAIVFLLIQDGKAAINLWYFDVLLGLLIGLILLKIIFVVKNRKKKDRKVIHSVAMVRKFIEANKKGNETDLDILIKLLAEEKRIRVDVLAKAFNVDKKIVEEWGKILEMNDVVFLDYPPVGEVEICKKK